MCVHQENCKTYCTINVSGTMKNSRIYVAYAEIVSMFFGRCKATNFFVIIIKPGFNGYIVE